MAQRALEHHVQDLEHRVATVEQILPTLATKADLADLRAATKADLADLRAATKTDLADLRAATKADLADLRAETKADLADLRAATKADLAAAVGPLATKAEVKADIQRAGEETRRHFDIVAEGLRAELRMVADGVVSLCATVDAHRAETASVLGNHESRLTRLETPRSKRR